jgi:hypothetical protein
VKWILRKLFVLADLSSHIFSNFAGIMANKILVVEDEGQIGLVLNMIPPQIGF